MVHDPSVLIERGRKTNQERSAIDAKSGFTPPERASKVELLRTGMKALWASISVRDATPDVAWDMVAESYALLETLEAALSGGVSDVEDSLRVGKTLCAAVGVDAWLRRVLIWGGGVIPR